MHSRRIHGTKLFMMLPINQASQKMRPLVLLSLINFLRHLSDFKLETKYNFLSRTYRVKKSSFQMFPYPKMILSLSQPGVGQEGVQWRGVTYTLQLKKALLGSEIIAAKN